MKARSDALNLCESFKNMVQENEISVEVVIRAIAIQSVIFERLNPVLWEEAIADARFGFSQAKPEAEQ